MSDGAAENEAETQGEQQEEAAGEGAATDELAELRRAYEQTRDQYLRLAAELDNVRKRSAREVENARKFGIERFAQSLLPVLDSLEAGLEAEHLDLDTLLEGQKATLRLLEQAFQEAGVERIDPRGEPFDPNLHEAMSALPAPHAEPDSVLEVIQKGYALRERLLRPARVVVARAAPEAEDTE